MKFTKSLISTLRTYSFLAATLMVACVSSASADSQTNTVMVAILEAVEQPLTLTTADLQAMPRVQLKLPEKDAREALFEGVALYDVVMRAKPKLSERCCSNIVNTVIVIKAADNYQATFSLPELDPKFNHGKVLLADRRDGQPLGLANGPLQIIVPDDKVHARWVRQVNSIEVLTIGAGRGGGTNSTPH